MCKGSAKNLICAAVIAAVLGSLALASAAGAHEPPPVVRATSLTQQGQDLVWYVRISRRFSAAGLRRGRASLCLLIERGNGKLRESVCFAPGRHGRPRVLLGRHTIDATVTRVGPDGVRAAFLPGSIGLHYRRLHWQTDLDCAANCGAPVPARHVPLKLHVPKLVGCVASGSTWVFHGPSHVRDIALTFDDGPWGQPPSIDFVNELARLHVPGTFFEIGDQISQFDPSGAVERAMLAHGDMIGDHTWTHPDMLTLGAAAQRSQLTMTNAAIKQATGFQVCLFRAPDGDVNPELLGLVRSLGMTTIQWDIDPRDWATPGVGAIESTIFAEATNGGIIEEHFGGGPRYETLDSLPDVVATLRRQGYRFVTLTQMLGYRLIYK